MNSQIRNRPDGTIIVFFDNTVVLPNVIDMTLDADKAEILPKGKTAWDTQLTFDTGVVLTVVYGAVNTTLDITILPDAP